MALKGLSGKVALVTGGAQGIGRATVARLLDEGVKVVSVDHDAEQLQTLRDEFSGGQLHGVVADVSREDDVNAAAQSAVDAFGAIDLLVNSAGVRGPAKPMTALSLDDFEAVMKVNVGGTFLCMQAALRRMVEQGRGGSIVNLSSLNALRANPGRTAYNVSKHAVIGLTKTAAVEFGSHGIRVNAIYPGAVATPMGLIADQTRQSAGWRMDYTLRPIPRKAEPAEVAAFIAWLLSAESSFQTGGAYTIDGGAMA